MARFSIRYTLAALALSITTLAVAPTAPALAAPTQAAPGPDFNFSMTTDNAAAKTRQQIYVRVRVGLTNTQSGPARIEMLFEDSFTNVKFVPASPGYTCTTGPDTFFDAKVTKMVCTTNRVNPGDTFRVSMNAPLIKTSTFFGGVRPIGAEDPDLSDNNSSGTVRIVGGVRID
jgi:hypothetical protein